MPVFVKYEGIMKINVMLMTECVAIVCKVLRYMKMNVMLMTECVASVCKVWRYYENECHVNDRMFS